MSAGSSSQLAACFSVDRTKYLMFSKSMPDRSEPQVGIGLWGDSGTALRPRGRDEVVEVLELVAGQIRAAGGHRLAAEQLQALQPQVQLPFRLVLLGRD